MRTAIRATIVVSREPPDDAPEAFMETLAICTDDTRTQTSRLLSRHDVQNLVYYALHALFILLAGKQHAMNVPCFVLGKLDAPFGDELDNVLLDRAQLSRIGGGQRVQIGGFSVV